MGEREKACPVVLQVLTDNPDSGSWSVCKCVRLFVSVLVYNSTGGVDRSRVVKKHLSFPVAVGGSVGLL